MPEQLPKQKQHRPVRPLSLSRGWILWEAWVAAMMIAQLLSLGVVLIAARMINLGDTIGTVRIFHLVGLLVGIILGLAQWLVLRQYIRHIGQWIAVTAIAAMVAWLVGTQASVMLAVSTSLDVTLTPELKTTTLLQGVFLLGIWVGSVLGLAQWLVLRRHVHRALGWVFANALAWGLGLVFACLAVGIKHANSSPLETVWVGAVTGLAMGAVVGAVTGFALVWLLKPRLLRRN